MSGNLHNSIGRHKYSYLPNENTTVQNCGESGQSPIWWYPILQLRLVPNSNLWSSRRVSLALGKENDLCSMRSFSLQESVLKRTIWFSFRTVVHLCVRKSFFCTSIKSLIANRTFAARSDLRHIKTRFDDVVVIFITYHSHWLIVVRPCRPAWDKTGECSLFRRDRNISECHSDDTSCNGCLGMKLALTTIRCVDLSSQFLTIVDFCQNN